MENFTAINTLQERYFQLTDIFAGDKTANKNVEMTMRVCDQHGKVVPVSIVK